jgi:dihydrofolate reductase
VRTSVHCKSEGRSFCRLRRQTPLRCKIEEVRPETKSEDEKLSTETGQVQSLDGYVAGVAGDPELPQIGVALHRYFSDQLRGVAGSLYGRRMYEVMRYWDEDRPEWGSVEHDFAAAWRAQPKWVVSRSLKSVGGNATLVSHEVEAFVRDLKSEVEGDIDVAGPELAGSLGDLGLIDEYHLYFRPFVRGRGKPYFAGARPPLRLVAGDSIGEGVIRLRYVPA